MKIMLTVEEDQQRMSKFFGRAPMFLVYDLETGERAFFENPAAQAESGAGIKAGQFAADAGVGALVSGMLGGNAAQVVRAAGIVIYEMAGEDIEENIAAYREGKLVEQTASHMGFFGR